MSADRTANRLFETGPLVRLVETELVDAGRAAATPTLNDHLEVAELLRNLVGHKDREHFVVLHLDVRHCARSAEIVSVGSLQAALVHPREVFKAAILSNSAAIICAHNHPSGDPGPSEGDLAMFERLASAGKLLDIPVLDFVIVTPHAVHSLLPVNQPVVDQKRMQRLLQEFS